MIRRREKSLVPENIWTSDQPASSLVGLNDPDKQKFSSPSFTSCYSLGKYSNKELKALPLHVTSQCSQLQPATEPGACAVWWYCCCSASVSVVEYSALFLAISKVCNLSSQAWTLGCVKWRNTGLFISPSGTSELDCATTKTCTAERSISIGRESLKVFFLY